MSTLESVLVKAPHQTNVHKVFCTAPWRGLQIDPTGDVKVCCAGKRNALGNLNDSSIQEILTGPAVSDLRQKMIEGKVPDYCKICTDAERYGGRSERHWHLEIDKDFNPIIEDPGTHRPSIVDVRWNNTCNLKCSYCFSMASSRWAAHEGLTVDSSIRRYYDDVESFVRKNSSSLREVALVGGEPLLLPENRKFIDAIPNHVNVTVITNLSNRLDQNSVFQKLCERPNVSWNVSFENTGERFEFVREGAKWQILLENLRTLEGLRSDRRHSIGIHAVFNVFVVTRLREILQLAMKHDLRILWQSLTNPEHFDPLRLGRGVADLAVSEIDYVLGHNMSSKYRDYFYNVKQQLLISDDCSQVENFKHAMYPRRGDFARLWPELQTLLS